MLKNLPVDFLGLVMRGLLIWGHNVMACPSGAGGCCCLETYKKYKCYRFPLCKLLIYKDLNRYLTFLSISVHNVSTLDGRSTQKGICSSSVCSSYF